MFPMFIPIPISGGGINRYWKLTLIMTATAFFIALLTAGLGLCPIDNNQNRTYYGTCQTNTWIHVLAVPVAFAFAVLTLYLKGRDL